MPCNPAYRQAIMLAWDALSGIPDKDLASDSGGELRGMELVLQTVGKETIVDLADRCVTAPDILGGGWGLATLHHLKGCLNWKRDDEWTSFDMLPSGRPFAQAFRQRALMPLAERYGKAPRDLLNDAVVLGGTRMEMGDAAVIVQAFPRLKIVIAAWQGDDEVPGRAVMLFDSGGARTLPAEDLAEVGISIAQAILSTDR
ncbi:MAG: DUF3786 domain-containing protein [Methanomassiliicoccales archaeon]